MKNKEFYQCEKCKTWYGTSEEAINCENSKLVEITNKPEIGSTISFTREIRTTNESSYDKCTGRLLGYILSTDGNANHVESPVVEVGDYECLLLQLDNEFLSLDSLVHDKGFYNLWMHS